MKRATTAWLGICLLISGMGLSACMEGSGDGPTSIGGEKDPIFRYDGKAGKCINGLGQTGLNPYVASTVRNSLNAECVDLSGVDLSLLKKEQIDLAPNDTLSGWNFKGASLAGSKLHFSTIEDAQLQGADLAEFQFGYVVIKGQVDKITRLPVYDCTVTGTTVYCLR